MDFKWLRTFGTRNFCLFLVLIDWTPRLCTTHPSRFIVPIEELSMILFPFTKHPIQITTRTLGDETGPVWKTSHSTPNQTTKRQYRIISIIFEVVVILSNLFQIRNGNFGFVVRSYFYFGWWNFSLLWTGSWNRLWSQMSVWSMRSTK